jgi:DNA polymerase
MTNGMRQATIAATFESWQVAARALLRDGVSPDQVVWIEGTGAGVDETATGVPRETTRVPRQFVELARRAARHPDPGRWRVLYAVLWRLVHERRDLLTVTDDTDVRALQALAGELSDAPGPLKGAERRRDGDPVPWALAPPDAATSAAPFVPRDGGLAALREAAARCTGCDLYRHASRTVFGMGPDDARVVLVGEQPGDQEDLKGAPFVGPAGEVLDRALVEVGLARDRVYVTNAVKHFKFERRGRRRIHQTPRAPELNACRPWIEAELRVIAPEVVVCLGATAARALIGPSFRLMQERGRFLETRWARKTIATLHPSAVLRGEDEETQRRLYGMLVEDLRVVAAAA